jgi:hypothetical protein
MPGPKRVFVGCPFTRSRRKSHGRLKPELEAETPLRLVLAKLQIGAVPVDRGLSLDYA